MEEYSIDSREHCFFCLDPVQPRVHSRLVKVKVEQGMEKPESYTMIQCLSRYLNLDMRKVFNNKGCRSVPPHLLANVNRSRVSVELCDECAQLGREFSELYQQLEMIEMRVGGYLSLIHGKLMRAEETDKFLRLRTTTMTGAEFDSGEDLEIVEVLRMEAIQKSSTKLRSILPRVEIESLKLEGVHKEAVNCNYEHCPDSDIEIGKVKMEMEHPPGGTDSSSIISDDDLCDIVDDDSINNPDMDCESSDSDIEIIDDIKVEPPMEILIPDDDTQLQNEAEPCVESMECGICHLPVSDLPYHLLTDHCEAGMKVEGNGYASLATPQVEEEEDSVSGNRKCSHCSKRFIDDEAYQVHYHKVHRTSRNPPNLFQNSDQSPIPTTFQSSTTTAVTINSKPPRTSWQSCEICLDMFPSKQARWDHQRAKHKGKKFACDHCPGLFTSNLGRVTHMRSTCPRLKE